MAISRSLATGKSRKSAGDLTFYTRLGVACFRQKPTRSPGYKSTVPQRMQQSVFKFMKLNVDASGVKAFIDSFYDAKPRKGKSETKMNMFYRAFMPHLVAVKSAIYELPEEAMINPGLFLGSPAINRDRLTNGVLGTLILGESSLSSITIEENSLNQILEKANRLISESAKPYTSNDVFVGIFGANPTSQTGYQLVPPTNVKPTLSDGIYTFNIASLTTGMSDTANVYVALMIAGVDASGGIDIMRRKFATDSAILNGATVNMVNATISAVTKGTGSDITMTLPKSAFDTAGANASEVVGAICTTISGSTSYATVKTATVSGSNVECSVTLVGANENDALVSVVLATGAMEFRPGSGGAGLALTNSFTATWTGGDSPDEV